MNIEYYTSSSGKCPIEKYLNNIKDTRHVRQILDDIELLLKFGFERLKKTADIEKIKGIKENIWELKTSCRGNIIYRTLFEFNDDNIHILNIFNKKDQKIRKTEIIKAISRLKY